MLRIVFIYFIFFGLISCTVYKSNFKDVSDKKIRILPFSNYINIEGIKLNKSDSIYNLLFDTGSNINLIDATVAKNFKFKTKGFKIVKDAYGRISMKKIIKIDSIAIQGITFYNLNAVVADLRSGINCIDFHGILGNPFLGKFDWYINKKEGYIVINPSNSEIKHFDKELSFKYNKRLPYLKGQVKKQKINFLFDTGSFDCNLTNDNLKLFESDSAIFYDFIWKSPNSKSQKQYARLNFPNEKVYLNNVGFQRLVRVSELQRPSIGWNFFDDGEFYIDYNDRLILYKEPQNLKYDFKSKIYFSSNENGSIIISGLFRTYKEIFNHLQLGDIVLSVNNRDVDLENTTICEQIYKLNSMETITSMKVIRSSEIFEIQIIN